MAQTDGEAVEAQAPSGWRIRIIGHDIIIVLLFAFIVVMTWTMFTSSTADHASIVRELRITSYILSLPPEKRPELYPPQEIYERTRQYQDWIKENERENIHNKNNFNERK